MVVHWLTASLVVHPVVAAVVIAATLGTTVAAAVAVAAAALHELPERGGHLDASSNHSATT